MVSFDDIPCVLEQVLKELELTRNRLDKVINKQNREIIPSVGALSKRLGVSKQTVLVWKDSGVIPYYQTGKTFFFYSDEIENALKNDLKYKERLNYAKSKALENLNNH